MSPFTDSQFEKFLQALDTRELLIRIDENTKNFHENFKKHEIDNSEDFGIQKQAINKSHERIDIFEGQMSKFKGMVIGVTSLATILLAALQVWIAIRF